MQSRITQFLKPQKGVLQNEMCRSCHRRALDMMRRFVDMPEALNETGDIKNEIRNYLSGIKYHWIDVYKDDLSARTRFVTKVNHATIHPVTFACVHVRVNMDKMSQKISDLATCTHMEAGIVAVTDDECNHALVFQRTQDKKGYDLHGKCETDTGRTHTLYFLFVRFNY